MTLHHPPSPLPPTTTTRISSRVDHFHFPDLLSSSYISQSVHTVHMDYGGGHNKRNFLFTILMFLEYEEIFKLYKIFAGKNGYRLVGGCHE